MLVFSTKPFFILFNSRFCSSESSTLLPCRAVSRLSKVAYSSQQQYKSADLLGDGGKGWHWTADNGGWSHCTWERLRPRASWSGARWSILNDVALDGMAQWILMEQHVLCMIRFDATVCHLHWCMLAKMEMYSEQCGPWWHGHGVAPSGHCAVLCGHFTRRRHGRAGQQQQW